jgi:hypothetical protein
MTEEDVLEQAGQLCWQKEREELDHRSHDLAEGDQEG